MVILMRHNRTTHVTASFFVCVPRVSVIYDNIKIIIITTLIRSSTDLLFFAGKNHVSGLTIVYTLSERVAHVSGLSLYIE